MVALDWLEAMISLIKSDRSRTHRRVGASTVWTALALFAASGITGTALAQSPAKATGEIPIIGGSDLSADEDGRQPIAPPGEGFTDVSVQSSDTGVATVEQPETNISGLGFKFKTAGNGVTVVTVTWTNSKTKEVRRQYYAIAVGQRLDKAEILRATIGTQVMVVAATGISKPVVSTSDPKVIGPDPKRPGYFLALGAGTSILTYTDTEHSEVYVVTVAPGTTTPSTGGGLQNDDRGGGGP